MRRSRLGWAGLISLLLHAVLLALLWEHTPARPVSPPPEPPMLVVDIVSTPSEPQPQPPPPQPPPPRPPPPRPQPPARVERPRPPTPAPLPAPLPSEQAPVSEAPAPSEQAPVSEAPPEELPVSPPPQPPPAPAEEASPPPAEAVPSAPAEPPAAEDAPLVEATPLPSLLPPMPEGGWSLPTPEKPEAPRGRTLRPGDPSLSPEVLRAEEQARVAERVQTWMEDDLAQLRVRNGLVHPYFGELRASLEKQLENSPFFDEALNSIVQQAVRSYMEEAERYGASGNPGRPLHERAPLTASERLETLSRGDPAHNGLRAFIGAGERVQQLAESKPELVVIVEMQQALDGQLSSVKVVETSGNKAFDKYVLEAVPPALVKLTPPPPEATGGRTQGIRTLWAVEGRVVYLKRLSELEGEDSWYVASAAALGLLAGRFEETTGDIYVIDVRNPRFVVRPRLLRLW